MSPLGPVLGACSPECVEGVSLLKNPSEIHSRAQRPAFAAFEPRFGSVRTPLWSIDWSDNDFFNSVSWPLPGHPEAMKMDP